MSEYRRVEDTFWTGPTGRQLRAAGRDAQLVALFLITGPLSHPIGLYHLPLAVLCCYTGLDLEGARKALRSLSEAHFAYYDEEAEEVWVPEMAARQHGEPLDSKDKRCLGIARAWGERRKSKFYRDFYTRYARSLHLPEPSPLEGASKPLPSQLQEQEQEQDKEKKKGPPAAAAPQDQKSEPKPKPEPLPPIPPQLDTPEFRSAWSEWVKHRHERKPAVTATSARNAFKIMARWGPARSVEAIRHSIAGGYQGIHEPKGGANGTGTTNAGGSVARVRDNLDQYDGLAKQVSANVQPPAASNGAAGSPPAAGAAGSVFDPFGPEGGHE
jgi:hypothetical protein